MIGKELTKIADENEEAQDVIDLANNKERVDELFEDVVEWASVHVDIRKYKRTFRTDNDEVIESLVRKLRDEGFSVYIHICEEGANCGLEEYIIAW